ncbi:hypothetical protein [Poseidonibacter lekithochrous]|uniref:hypothetical protein n=1 Tax=Poseidonibacter lekithochrous TaxID=1904463 RepID=UPI0008FC6DC5|nr:hypothetical protein [Poseidonibacter lekithochrous]QKJ22006.1 hypothetical protein ALEK_0703 [Poseidonibacter lekithochrous]
MTQRTFEKDTFVGFEFLPAEPTFNSIEIFHPFANLANKYFSSKGYNIITLQSGSIKISFEDLNKKEKMKLSNEIRKFLKDSRQEVINDFLIYKNGISCL